MKSYIDVSFTMEEDLSHWSEEGKNQITQNIDKITKYAKKDLLEKLNEYEDIIKNFNVIVTFEDRS